tara:strand:+ start:448 stop:990 length:543 start_codon:yes stop_codon:yes gene_type:complete
VKNKKKRFLIFFVFNVFLLILIFLLVIPFSSFLSGIKLKDNEFVKDQIIINPEKKTPEILDRKIKIKLIAKVGENLNWDFKPIEKNIELKIGENKIINYEGKNLTKETITSTANFKVEPEEILPYLIKSECFCFIEQTLKSGESKIFTMVFYIDPSLDSDQNFDNLKELVFTYDFSEYKS